MTRHHNGVPPDPGLAHNYVAPASSTVARALLNDPDWLPSLDLFPEWAPGDPGRPPALPNAVYWYVNACLPGFHSHRRSLAEISAPHTWRHVRTTFMRMTGPDGRRRYPHPGLDDDTHPPSWSAYQRFRKTYAKYGPTAPLLAAATAGGAALAVEIGLFDPRTDSVTSPSPRTCVAGDGVVFGARSKHDEGARKRHYDRTTGEITDGRLLKHDPDAQLHRRHDTTETEDDDDADDDDPTSLAPKAARSYPDPVSTEDPEIPSTKKWVYGLKFASLHAHNGYPGESVSFGTAPISKDARGYTTKENERTVILDLLDRLRSALPDTHAVRTLVYDGVATGIWASDLYQRDVLTVSRPHLARNSTGYKSRLIGTDGKHQAKCPDGTERTVELRGIGHRPHVRVHSRGEDHDIPLDRHKIDPRPRKRTTTAWYGTFRIPDHDKRVPKKLRGATVMIRLDPTAEDQRTGFNRPEIVRPLYLDPDDPVWRSLMTRRPFSESFNNSQKQTVANNGRRAAPAWGFDRTHWDMVAHQFWHNARTRVIHNKRTKKQAQRTTAGLPNVDPAHLPAASTTDEAAAA